MLSKVLMCECVSYFQFTVVKIARITKQQLILYGVFCDDLVVHVLLHYYDSLAICDPICENLT